MLVVDTSVWIDFFGVKQSAAAERLKHEVSRTVIGVADLVLCEVLQGIREERTALNITTSMLAFASFSCAGQELAIDAAKNYRALRSKGFTVRSSIDCLLATYCLQNDCNLLHRDRDFDVFESELGLRVVSV